MQRSVMLSLLLHVIALRCETAQRAFLAHDFTGVVAPEALLECQTYAQYAVLGSYCVSYPRPSPCLRNFTECVSHLASSKNSFGYPLLAPVLTLPTTNIYNFSTYSPSHCFGANGAFLVRKEISGANSLIVTFAGSTTTQDWINDFKAWMISYVPIVSNAIASFEGAQVHFGFYSIYVTLRATLLDMFKRIRGSHSFTQIMFTGHSLGGILAALFFMDVRLCQVSPVECPFQVDDGVTLKLFTFGQPRFGNAELMKAFQGYAEPANIFRFVNPHDLAPHLPPVALGYVHVIGRYFMILDDGVVLQCDTRSKTDSCRSLRIPADGHGRYFWNFELVKSECMIMESV